VRCNCHSTDVITVHVYVIQQENDVNSCGRTEQMIHELATAVSQLHREVAELKAFIQQKVVKGICLKADGRLSRTVECKIFR